MGLIREFKELPGTVKVFTELSGVIVLGATIVVVGIPLAILLIAFPKLLILIGVFALLLGIGYIRGRNG